MKTQYLSLQDLENFDVKSPNRGKERRFACPLCGQNKPIDAPHRSLAVNTENGSFFCHRCQTKGRLKEFWEARPITHKKVQTRKKLTDNFSIIAKKDIKDDKELVESKQKTDDLRDKMAEYQSDFLHSPAEMYLLNRGISTNIATKAGCGYAEKWEHWEKENEKWKLKGTDKRVVFPIYDQNGKLVAIHGRSIEENSFGSPKITKGDKSNGVFLSDAHYFKSKFLAVCEGAIDAMSLELAGIPAIAMTGTTPPDWFIRKMAFRNVLLATDADEAGDIAAYKLKLELQSRGARVFRLRPKFGKDWGEFLELRGEAGMQKDLDIFSNMNDWDRYQKTLKIIDAGRTDLARFIAEIIQDLELKADLLLKTQFSQQLAA